MMIKLDQLKLPIRHSEEDLKNEIVKKLRIKKIN